ncbi:MAG: hypothetical protein R3C11_08800 [Planctomycetaceae bacterium]
MFGRRELKTYLSQQFSTWLDVMLHSLSFRLFLLGLLLGPIALAIVHHYFALAGSEFTARTGGTLAIAVGLAWATSRGLLPGLFSDRRRWHRYLPVWIQAILGLVLCIVLLPHLDALHQILIKQFSTDLLNEFWGQLLFYFLLGLVSLSLPAYWLVRTVDSLAGDLVGMEVSQQRRVQYQRYLFRYGTGLLCGVIFTSLLLAPLFGLQVIAWICATTLVVICIERLVQGNAVKGVQSPLSFQALLQEERTPLAGKLWQSGIWIVLGGLLFLLQRMFSQYMPGTVYVPLFLWIGFGIGLLWGTHFIALRQRFSKGAQEEVASTLLLTIVLASAWTVLWLLASEWLLTGSLWISASWSQTWLITCVRLSCIVIAVAPLGITAVCSLLPSQQSGGINSLSPFRPHRILSLVAGGIIIQWLFTAGFSFFSLAIGCQWLLLILAGLQWARTWKFAYSKPVITGLCAALLLILAAPITNQMFDASRTAKYLFSSDVYASYRNGTDPQELEVLSDQRLLKQVEGASATYTVWSQNGLQQIVRADGLPQAVASLDTTLIPEHSGEILQAIFPMSLHPAPHEVLMLGIPSGVAVKSCLQFPLQQLTCVESESAVLEIARESSWRDQSPEADIRFQLLDLPQQIALGEVGPQDVIISAPPMSMLERGTSYYTLEFYNQAAAALREEGIFCQRFQHFDYGSQPLCDVVATLRAAFRSVCTIQSAPGEVLLVGTNSELGLDRAGLLNRFRKPHTRHALASLGWDWAVPLEVLQLDDDAWTEILDKQPGKINTASNGRLAFSLPHEMLRWGNKGLELQALVGSHYDNMYSWIKDEDDDHQVSHRFEELKALRELQLASNGKYWIYRSTVRQRLEQKPRTVIKQVKGEGVQERLHEEDRRRLEYFESLGDAFQAAEIRPSHLQEIEQFSQPYDPLVTYFSHMELAALCERKPDEYAAEEFRHLLHTIFYSSSQDKSIRNVSRAIALMVEHPEIVPEESRRADMLNAMLQVMKSRWTLRGTTPVGSLGMSQKEVTDSLQAIELAFEEFHKFQQNEQLKAYPWAERENHLERYLVSPLRTYRSQLSTAQAKREHDLETAEASSANATLQQQVREDAEKLKTAEEPGLIDNAVFETPRF